jgi:Spy/CpxP family protein refolding chaperone
VTEQVQPATPPGKTHCCRHGGRGRIWLVLLLVALASAFAGAVMAKAFHIHPPFPAGPMFMMMNAPSNAAEAEEHAAWMAKHLSRRIDATTEQKTKLTAIATATAKDLFPLREKMVASRKQAIELMRQPAVSRDDIERLRAEQLGNADALSKRLAQAIGDMTEVLTLEQRKELADDVSHFSRHWGG